MTLAKFSNIRQQKDSGKLPVIASRRAMIADEFLITLSGSNRPFDFFIEKLFYFANFLLV